MAITNSSASAASKSGFPARAAVFIKLQSVNVYQKPDRQEGLAAKRAPT